MLKIVILDQSKSGFEAVGLRHIWKSQIATYLDLSRKNQEIWGLEFVELGYFES